MPNPYSLREPTGWLDRSKRTLWDIRAASVAAGLGGRCRTAVSLVANDQSEAGSEARRSNLVPVFRAAGSSRGVEAPRHAGLDGACPHPHVRRDTLQERP